MAATGGDNDFNAGVFGEAKGGEVAGADLAMAVEERSVHVDGDDAWWHVSRLGHVGAGVAATRWIGFGLANDSGETFMVVEVRRWAVWGEVG